MTLLEIESATSNSDLTLEEWENCLWYYLCGNKKRVRLLARELNVFPSLRNVFDEINNRLLSHIKETKCI